MKAFGIPSIELSGYEADDIIATYASLAENKKWSVSIVSSDKDLMQIVSNQVKLIDTMKNKTIGPNEVLESLVLVQKMLLMFKHWLVIVLTMYQVHQVLELKLQRSLLMNFRVLRIFWKTMRKLNSKSAEKQSGIVGKISL